LLLSAILLVCLLGLFSAPSRQPGKAQANQGNPVPANSAGMPTLPPPKSQEPEKQQSGSWLIKLL
jgi:hypothetical protein